MAYWTRPRSDEFRSPAACCCSYKQCSLEWRYKMLHIGVDLPSSGFGDSRNLRFNNYLSIYWAKKLGLPLVEIELDGFHVWAVLRRGGIIPAFRQGEWLCDNGHNALHCTATLQHCNFVLGNNFKIYWEAKVKLTWPTAASPGHSMVGHCKIWR